MRFSHIGVTDWDAYDGVEPLVRKPMKFARLCHLIEFAVDHFDHCGGMRPERSDNPGELLARPIARRRMQNDRDHKAPSSRLLSIGLRQANLIGRHRVLAVRAKTRENHVSPLFIGSLKLKLLPLWRFTQGTPRL
jgi:hypothetical protein